MKHASLDESCLSWYEITKIAFESSGIFIRTLQLWGSREGEKVTVGENACTSLQGQKLEGG